MWTKEGGDQGIGLWATKRRTNTKDEPRLNLANHQILNKMFTNGTNRCTPNPITTTPNRHQTDANQSHKTRDPEPDHNQDLKTKDTESTDPTQNPINRQHL